jgi:general secretion pathway protein G
MKSFALRGRPTLRALLAVTAAVAALLAIALPLYFDSVGKSKETALRQSLHSMRDAIDRFYTDNARYPDALGDLVDKRYLREIPVDPITGSAQTWAVVAPPEGSSGPGKVFDVKSGAKGQTPEDVEFANL